MLFSFLKYTVSLVVFLLSVTHEKSLVVGSMDHAEVRMQ
jgi:hypothetical protein